MVVSLLHKKNAANNMQTLLSPITPFNFKKNKTHVLTPNPNPTFHIGPTLYDVSFVLHMFFRDFVPQNDNFCKGR